MVVGVGPYAARLGLTARLRCVPATETASVATAVARFDQTNPKPALSLAFGPIRC
jgi:hypothetical protein